MSAVGDRVILVTGATGRQGRAVVRHLLQGGWSVRALTRDPNQPAARELAAAGAEVVSGDLQDEDSLRRATVGVYGVWTPDGISVDPMAAVKGPEEITQMVSSVQEQFPGHKFSQVGDLYEHHDRVLFHWQMASPKGNITISGLDCVRVDEQGRFAELTDFFTGP